MRGDLSPAFIAAMESRSRAPIQFMDIHRPDGTTIYVSDRELIIGENQYLAVVESWGELTTAGYNLTDFISETLQVSVTFWNGGGIPFSAAFFETDLTDVFVTIYQTFEGLSESDAAVLGEFVIQDPITTSERSALFTIDLVSHNMRYTANVGKVLTVADYPQALESDLNRGIDLIVGDAGEVQTLAAKTPITATQKGSILKLPTILNVHENLDEKGFPQSGYITVDLETMFYSSRDSDTFNITARGQKGTTISEHSDGSIVREYLEDHIFIIGQGPISSISEVKAGGILVDPIEYTTDLLSNPATITFSKQPTHIDYSLGARSTTLDFDATSGNNGAYQPHYSYDSTARSYGALINKFNNPLAVLQVDPADDDGEVVRVFITVEHWSTKVYANDLLNIWVDGIGIIGSLSRPNPGDIIDVSGDVNIDHGHIHETGGNHDHGFTNPDLETDNPSHKHETTAAGPTYTDGGDIGLPVTKSIYTGTSYTEFNYAGYANVSSKRIRVRFRQTGVAAVYLSYSIYGSNIVSWDSTDKLVDQWVNISPTTTRLYLRYTGAGVVGGNVIIYEMTMETTVSGAVEYFQTAVEALHANTGNVALKNIDTTGLALKDAADVQALITANEPINITSSTSSTKKIIERFDLTKYLETIDWSFLVNREVQVQYFGTSNDANTFITYIQFEVEYRQREVKETNIITCRPVGSIPNRPDQVIQYLLHNIAGVPLESMGSIWANPEAWDDVLAWVDTDIWIDRGEREDVTDTYFDDAGSRYQYLGYTIDGIIPARDTVKDAVRKICKQSRGRLTWSAGKVKLSVREKLENWQTVRQIGPSNTQIRSVEITKTKVEDIYNEIDLFYKIDRLSNASDEGQFNATTSRIDQGSIDVHGQRKENSEWLFDLVRSDIMADDLVDYYIWRYGEPATQYKFNAYLQQFDIEKGDVIRFTSGYMRTNDKPIRIVENQRQFGSGKTSLINTITLIGEAIRQNDLILRLSDVVVVYGEITIGVPQEQFINDPVSALDEILFLSGELPDDSLSLVDQFSITLSFAPKLNETVSAADSIAATLFVEFSDNITSTDSFLIQDALCFGSCGFGGPIVGDNCILPFGSIHNYDDSQTEIIGIGDEAIVAALYSIVVDDSINVTDILFSSESFNDTASTSEELIFNSCFGCPVSGATGFGLNNFGG